VDEEVKQKNAQIEVDNLYTIQGNPGLIRPLFYNLINNALKYSKKDVSPVIKIRSELSMAVNGRNANQEATNRYCRIYIEDNGIGFDQKYAEEIFGMFKRLHRHAEFEGTGIGLALCKKIVEQHNGYISARSKINEGSTFIISLPLLHQKEAVIK
jgi:signal transduction histidine kinase